MNNVAEKRLVEIQGMLNVSVVKLAELQRILDKDIKPKDARNARDILCKMTQLKQLMMLFKLEVIEIRKELVEILV